MIMYRKNGFTLIELSIVLVIIGLIAGGVLVGYTLIEGAENRSVIAEYQDYSNAVLIFQDRYKATPGDMDNATTFWGVAATCPGTISTPRTSEATCNGNGNGDIEQSTANANEIFNFWHHLSNAGLISGFYSGVANNAAFGTQHVSIGWNIPSSAVKGAGWQPRSLGIQTVSSSTYIEGVYNLTLTFAAVASNGYLQESGIAPSRAYNIDKKIDDGIAGEGIIVSRENKNFCYRNSDGSYLNFSTSQPRNMVIYDADREDKQCVLYFRRIGK